MDLDWFGASCSEKQLAVPCIANDLANSNTMLVTVNFLFEITDREKGIEVLGEETLERLRLGKHPLVIYFLGETTAGQQLQPDVHWTALLGSKLHKLRVMQRASR